MSTIQDLLGELLEILAIRHDVGQAVLATGKASMGVTKSPVAFGRRRGFPYVWRPGQYVASDVPAVPSLALPYEIGSDRLR